MIDLNSTVQYFFFGTDNILQEHTKSSKSKAQIQG